MKITSKMACLSVIFALFQIAQANTVINNNNNNQQPQGGGGCNNSNYQIDPRIAPEGTYTTHNNDGSSQTVYTTGEKRPYIVDNNCNSNPAPYIQPNVYTQQRRPLPPGPLYKR